MPQHRPGGIHSYNILSLVQPSGCAALLVLLILAGYPMVSLGQTGQPPQHVPARVDSGSLLDTPGDWQHVRLDEKIPANRFEATLRDGQPAVKIHSSASMSLLARPINVDLSQTPVLCWRWRINAPLKSADMTTKQGDDYAARLYISLTLPESEKGFFLNAQLAMARAIWGPHVPDAAVNYVWDNRQPIGTERPNAYTDRTTMVVVQSGAAYAGRWVGESRNLRSDISRLYSPNASAVQLAIAADTDNTGESATAEFADIHFAKDADGCRFQ